VETSTGDAPAPRAPDFSVAALDGLRRTLQKRSAQPARATVAVPRAAVVLLLRAGTAGVEILLIKRAERDDDPWSGHVALPGGREEPTDRSLEETAIRETREEIGLDLTQAGEVLGALDDLEPRSAPRAIVVRPFVAVLRADTPLALSDEVAAAFWVPLAVLTASEAVVESIVRVGGTERRVASFRHGEYVVWGMTERILRQLLSVLAHPTFPAGTADAPEKLETRN
jgi:ADP-ribose pyrophosphatase YjhB (NUDIX family)